MSLYKKGATGLRAPTSWPGWVYPLPIWEDHIPYVTDKFQTALSETHRQHLGVDVMYPSTQADKPLHTFPQETKSERAFIPDPIRALAAGPGEIWHARMSPKGYEILIDHGSVEGVGVTTYYQHLRDLNGLEKGDHVHAGQELGLVGGDIMKGGYPLWHLHFGMQFPRKGVKSSDAWVNPLPYMSLWPMLDLRPDGSYVLVGIPRGGSYQRVSSVHSDRSSIETIAPVAIGLALGIGIALLV